MSANLEKYRLPGENWKDIAGYEGRYLVSDYGRCWNCRTDRPISMHKAAPYKVDPRSGKKCFYRDNPRMYYAVMLYGPQRHMRVHRLVAEAFCPNDDPELKTVVDHIDNDPLNNMARNLRWVTPSGNMKNAFGEEQEYTRWLMNKLETDKETA
nr:NUMOD4 motif-containing HNH endonuclease [Clostridia bacterium]